MSKVMHTVVTSLLAALPFTIVPITEGAAQELQSFGVVSGQSLTNTGPTTIVGNIAVNPGTSYTGSDDVTQVGEVFLGDAVSGRIQNDLTTLYTVLEGRPTSQSGDLTGQDLGGMTLTAGVYNFDTSAGLAAGQTLTLDAGGNPDAIFIFNIGTTLTAGSGATVVLENGAQGGNVFYRVGSSATLDTSSDLQGQIVALTSITMNTSASVSCGAVHARNGSVTLDTNTIEICRLDAQGYDIATKNLTLTKSQQAVAAALNEHVAAGGVLPIGLAILPATLTPAELAVSLAQLTGEVSTGVAPMGFQAMSGFMDTVVRSGRKLRLPAAAPRDTGVPVGLVLDKINTPYSGKYGSEPESGLQVLAYPATVAQPSRDWDIWASGYGTSSVVEADADLGFQERIYDDKGFAAGLNYAISNRTNIGVALSWNVANFALDDGLGSGASDTVFLALRGRTSSDRGYLEGALGYGLSDVTTDRSVTIAGVDQFTAATTADTLAAYVEAGYDMGAFTPFAAVRAQSLKMPAYSEAAVAGSSSYALDYDASTATSVRSELGVDIRWSKDLATNGSSSFGVRAAWAHEFASNDPTKRAFQTLPDVEFPVAVASQDRDSVILAASVGLVSANGFSIDGSLNAEYSANSKGYGGSLTVGYRW